MVQLSRRFKNLALLGGAFCSMIGGVVLWKETLAGETYVYKEKKNKKIEKKTFEDKVFVVTGATSGIGKATAWELARLKGRVFMACRNMVKCEQIRKEIVLDTFNKYVYCRECDLASFTSIRNFVKEFKTKESKLDVLINNAAVMNHPRKYTKDGIELHLQTNALGPFLLTNLLLDDLEKSQKGRVIFLTNLDYRKGVVDFDNLNFQNSWNKSQAFTQSQLAMMLLMSELSKRTKDKNIAVLAAYPGITNTNIKRHMGVDSSIIGNFISHPILWFLSMNPERGAQTSLFLALDDDISVESSSGKLFSKMSSINIDPIALDEAISKRLYAVAAYWTGLVDSKEEVKKVLVDDSKKQE